jgi:hypothetical protein
MNMYRCLVALAIALLLATPALPSQIDVPPGSGGTLIVLADQSQVHVHADDGIEVSARAIAADRASGRMDVRGDVHIKVMHDGSELITITTSSAVITRVPGEVPSR